MYERTAVLEKRKGTTLSPTTQIPNFGTKQQQAAWIRVMSQGMWCVCVCVCEVNVTLKGWPRIEGVGWGGGW